MVLTTREGRAEAGRWRRVVVIANVVFALFVMGAVFWEQDLRYSLPTERPPGLVQRPIGDTVELPPTLAACVDTGRPLLLNFYNPDCPCSRYGARRS